jgi:predicted P-loop ATPase
MSAVKVWICELGEIDSITKEQSALKAFLLEQTDRFREPYARCESIRPRRTSFCGTVNPKAYLRDETGNRRYWTVPVERIDVKQIFSLPPEWYAQFWRQMQAEYRRDPESYLLTPQELDTLNGRNEAFETDIYGEDEFMTVFDPHAPVECWQWRTAAQIADTLNNQYHGLNIRSEIHGRAADTPHRKAHGQDL